MRQGSLRLITLVPTFCILGISFSKSPVLTSISELTHEGCGWLPVMWYITATRCLCCIVSRMRMGHYAGIPTRRVSVFKLGLAFARYSHVWCSSKVNFIVRLRSLQRVAEAISQGYCSPVQRPLVCEVVSTSIVIKRLSTSCKKRHILRFMVYSYSNFSCFRIMQ